MQALNLYLIGNSQKTSQEQRHYVNPKALLYISHAIFIGEMLEYMFLGLNICKVFLLTPDQKKKWKAESLNDRKRWYEAKNQN